MTHPLCTEIDVTSFGIRTKFLQLVIEAFVVNEVVCAVFFLEGFFISGQLFIEFGIINVVESGFELKIPDFIYQQLEPGAFMKGFNKGIQFQLGQRIGDAVMLTAFLRYRISKEVTDVTTL